ncbi:MAG: hypothetical protein GVY30_00075 [Chloroflexi bacterium]|jgi:hypothetical protein|nr:hypothetical protein [Chloroflexota bacterium]
MSNPETFKFALARVLTDRPIAYHPELASIGGGAAAGIFLSQLLYWTPRGKLPDGWIWKSAKEWEEETGLTPTEQRRARRKLKERELINEDLAGVPATLHFQVDLDRLAELLTGEGFPQDNDPLPRDEHGRFISEEETPSLPETGKLNEAPPSLPKTGKLDHRKPENKHAGNRKTSSPETGQLSRDYPETTPEIPDIISNEPQPTSEESTTSAEEQFTSLFGPDPEPTKPKEKIDWTNEEERNRRLRNASRRYGERTGATGADPDRRRIHARDGISAENLYSVHRTLRDAGIPTPGSDARWRRWRPMLVALYQESNGDLERVKAAAELLKEKMREGYAKGIGKWSDYIGEAQMLRQKKGGAKKYTHPDDNQPGEIDELADRDMQRILKLEEA